jgi:hypothetical protein
MSFDDLKAVPKIHMRSKDDFNGAGIINTTLNFQKVFAVGTLYKAQLSDGTYLFEYESFVQCS